MEAAIALPVERPAPGPPGLPVVRFGAKCGTVLLTNDARRPMNLWRCLQPVCWGRVWLLVPGLRGGSGTISYWQNSMNPAGAGYPTKAELQRRT